MRDEAVISPESLPRKPWRDPEKNTEKAVSGEPHTASEVSTTEGNCGPAPSGFRFCPRIFARALAA